MEKQNTICHELGHALGLGNIGDVVGSGKFTDHIMNEKTDANQYHYAPVEGDEIGAKMRWHH